MPRNHKSSDETAELLRALLIVQLGLAAVPQPSIRAIAKCDMNLVNKILKPVLAAKKKISKRSNDNG